MFRFNKKISQQEKDLCLMESMVLFSSLLFYYMYAIKDELILGILFVVFAVFTIFFKYIIYKNELCVLSKSFFVCKDNILIICTSIIFATIIYLKDSFSLEYSTHIVYNILFVFYTCFIVYFNMSFLNRS